MGICGCSGANWDLSTAGTLEKKRKENEGKFLATAKAELAKSVSSHGLSRLRTLMAWD